MKLLLIILLACLLVIFAGCTQMISQASSELNTCMQKCSDLCGIVKNSSMDMAGYNTVGISKKSGSVTVECSCPCAK